MGLYLYKNLKFSLGRTDAVNECIEVLLRKFEVESKGEEQFQIVAENFGIKVTDVSTSTAVECVRRHYLITVYRVFEEFLQEFDKHLSKYTCSWVSKQDGESPLKYIYKNVLGLEKNNTEEYIYYLICDYYRLIRNYIAHAENKVKIRDVTNAYMRVINCEEIQSLFPRVKAPNRYDSVNFDDFILYSRAVKKLAEKFISSIDYNLDKIVDSIEINRFYKLKNNKNRLEKALRNEVLMHFNVNTEQTNTIVEKLLQMV